MPYSAFKVSEMFSISQNNIYEASKGCPEAGQCNARQIMIVRYVEQQTQCKAKLVRIQKLSKTFALKRAIPTVM